jgi:hypothetical protein
VSEVGDEVTVKVVSVGNGVMKVTSPDAPNYKRLARNVQDLGLAVREVHGWVRLHRSVPYSDAGADLPPAKAIHTPIDKRPVENLVCTGCGKAWMRRRRNGRKPAYCDSCHPLYLPHLPREPQEVIVA